MGLNLGAVEAGVTEKVKSIEEKFESLKLHTERELEKKSLSAAASRAGPFTAIMGKVPGATTLQEAKDWAEKHFTSKRVPQPVDMYIKGDVYKDIVWVKCGSESHRDQVIASIRQVTGETRPWADADRPIDERTAKSALLALKRQLVEWGYSSKEVQVDADKQTLSVGGSEVVQAKVQDSSLKMVWSDGEWEKWDVLQAAPELSSIVDGANEKLSRAKDTMGKGKKGSGKNSE